MREGARCGQDRQLRVGEELVEVRRPIGHLDVTAALRTELRTVEEHHNHAVRRVDLLHVEVVLRHAHVALEDATAAPVRQPHVGLLGVGTTPDNLGAVRPVAA